MGIKEKFTGRDVSDKKKWILCVLVVISIFAVYYYLFYKPVRENIQILEQQKVTLEGKIKEQKIIARDLPAFKKEVAKLEVEFNKLLEQLPNSSEIPKLLRNISDVGKDSGLDFLKFAPKGETSKEFYAEIPVDISVTGGFHDFGTFVDSVSRLPRIVNVSNVVFESPRIGRGKAEMKIMCTATTFRFIRKEK